MFARAQSAAKDLGIESSLWTLQEGSITTGIAYRMFTRNNGESGLRDIGGLSNGFLGMTAKDAFNALQFMAVAWEYVKQCESR
jgi:hypothetical protein